LFILAIDSKYRVAIAAALEHTPFIASIDPDLSRPQQRKMTS
jgi:hypothetical protein